MHLIVLSFLFAAVSAFAPVEHIERFQKETSCKQEFARYLAPPNNCKPVDTVVQLSSPNGKMMIPRRVTVPRCGGCGMCGCPANKACQPTDERIQEFSFVTYGHKSGECVRAPVTVHKRCECRCPDVDKQRCDANKHRTYNDSTCTCECMHNKSRRKECVERGRRWDEDTCRCVCENEWMECSTGTEWVPRFCKCMRLMREDF